MSVRIPRARRLGAGIAALAAAAALLLSGCASIPRDGQVVHGGAVKDQQDNGFGRSSYIADPPFPGETQQQILEGFIAAARSPDNGYAVARQYLSTDQRSKWNPDAGVTIVQDTDPETTTQLNSTELDLAISPVAQVDASGAYLPTESSGPQSLPFGFTQENGQWRINALQPGIVLDTNAFPDVFTAYPLYFYSPDHQYLVPDERWFPSTGPVATRIAQQLLAGPSPWLQGAVTSAFPKGAQLVGGSVPVQSGAAQVGIGSVAAGIDQQTITYMYGQLAASLVGRAPVTGVTLSIDGVDQGTELPKRGVQNPGVDADPVVLKGDAFGPLAGSAPTGLGDVGKLVAGLKPSAVTLSAGGDNAALLAAGAVYAVVNGSKQARAVDTRPGLIAPALDAADDVWSVPGDRPGAFRITPPTGDPVTLNVSWPSGRAISSFAISRDGTRLAAVIRTSAGISHVMVAAVVRDSAGRPTGLTAPIDLGPAGLNDGPSDAVSITWVDELDVAVLGPGSQGDTVVVTQQIGGVQSSQAGPQNAVFLTAGSGATPLWALTKDGELLVSRGGDWQKKTDGVAVLAAQMGRLP